MKEKLHKLFNGYIITCRDSSAVVFLGYFEAPANMRAYNEDAFNKAVEICENNGLNYKVEYKTAYRHRKTQIRITF